MIPSLPTNQGEKMADQPTSQGTKVGKTNVKQQGQTVGQYGSEYDRKGPSPVRPADVKP